MAINPKTVMIVEDEPDAAELFAEMMRVSGYHVLKAHASTLAIKLIAQHKLNPEVKLPDRTILVVYRSDGSGTTYNWTDYLSKVSEQWHAKAGAGTSVAWPVEVGGKGNSGVASAVAKVKGAIGYVEYTYAQGANLVYGLVRNKAGNFVAPDAAGFRAATEGVDWAKEPDFYVLLSDSDSPTAWPIMATSFALVREYPKDAARRDATLAFFRWANEKGQEQVGEMHHLPLPPPLVRQIEDYWGKNVH